MQTGRICKNKGNIATKREQISEQDVQVIRKLGRVRSQPSLPAQLLKTAPNHAKTIAQNTDNVLEESYQDVKHPQKTLFDQKYRTLQEQTQSFDHTKFTLRQPQNYQKERLCFQNQEADGPHDQMAEAMDAVFEVDRRNKEHIRKMDEFYQNRIRQLECQCSAKDSIIEQLKGLLKDKEQQIQNMEKMYVVDSRFNTSRAK